MCGLTRRQSKSATFQAWGRRGPDREQALNLGVFYKGFQVSLNKSWAPPACTIRANIRGEGGLRWPLE